MKAVFLCAGEGTRLRPITYVIPKALVPVGGKPVLVHGIENVKRAGVKDVVIVVNPRNRYQFEEYFNENDPGVNVSFAIQEKPLGLAHAVASARDLIDEDFILYLGDNLIFEDIEKVLEEFDGNDALILLDEVDDPRRFGVAVLEDGFVKKVVEKPKEPPSDLAIVGLYVFKPSVFDFIDKLEPSWRGEYEITDAIQLLVDAGLKVKGKVMEGWWKDVGRLEDLLDANARVLEEMNVSIDLGEGGEVFDSRINGPVLGAGNVEIKMSEVGPNVYIGRGARIESSHISNAIVLDGARISHSRIENAFVGANAHINGLKTHKTAIVNDTVILVKS